MTVVLLILKIIGIALLIILGLLLLAILAILFVPVRYRVTGSIEDSVSVRFRVTWLLGIILFRGQYENKEYRQKLKIFGISLQKKEEASGKKKRSVRRKKPKKSKEQKNRPDDVIKTEDSVKTEIKNISQEEKRTNKNGKRQNKVKHFFHILKSLPSMIKSKLENLKEKIKNFRETAGRIKQAIQNETNREAVKVLFRELKYLLRHISPRRVKAELSFGMEDPAATGQILGVISMLPFIYRYQLKLYPDFETDKFYLKGPFDIKGHAQGIYVLIMGYHLIKDKNIRDLIQRYRNL